MLYPLSYGSNASLPRGTIHSFERDPDDSETYLQYRFSHCGTDSLGRRPSSGPDLGLDLSQIPIESNEETLEVEWFRQVVARAGVTESLDLIV